MSESSYSRDNVTADFGSSVIAPMRAGRYEVRLAATSAEVLAAQRLRYRVMYEEKHGHPDLQKIKARADIDEWDERAFHIIVVNHTVSTLKVMGTLRLVSNLSLNDGQRFYTEHAFDLSGLRERYRSILELGRFCIDASGRQGAILMLIWKFAMQFIADNRVDVMMGCASFPGTDVVRHKAVLGFLYKHNLAPPSLRPRPIVSNHMDIASVCDTTVDFEDATRDIPTLLRGYLKLGAKIGDTAVMDRVFNTTFICIYVDAAQMHAAATGLVTSRKPAC